MSAEILRLFENSGLFSGLDPEITKGLAASATRKALGANEILFQKGDPADSFWGVISGRIVIQVTTDDGKEMELDSFASGEFLGEVGLLDFGPRRVDAVADQQTEVIRIRRQQFLNYLERSPELCFRIFSLLCSDLRLATETIEDTALYTLPARLAKKLIALKDDEPDRGECQHDSLKVSQFKLARLLGVHRQTINRQLRAWEKRGWLTLMRGQVVIHDLKALAALAAPGQSGKNHDWITKGDIRNLPDGFRNTGVLTTKKLPPGPRKVGILAVDAAEYSALLMTDAAGTLKKLEEGMAAIDKSIEEGDGRLVSHTGDRVLAEFPDATRAFKAALAIQKRIDRPGVIGAREPQSIFRIGVHYGEVLATENEFLGEAVNIVVRLTDMPGAGGIYLSGQAHESLELPDTPKLQFLGIHELKNVVDPVSIYAARPLPFYEKIFFRVETLVPRRFRLAAITVTAIVLATGIWLAGDWMGRQSAVLIVSPLSIAVLPFTTGGDPALDYLAEGIPEEIRARLSTIAGMQIIGRESSGYYSDRATSAEKIAQDLQVTWLLQGRFESVDEETLSTVLLFNSVNNEVVWEEQFPEFDGNLAGFGLDIVERIVSSLGIDNSATAGLLRLRPLTENPEAYELYLEAQSYLWRASSEDTFKSIPLLQSAVELDPSFAEAHALLAKIYLYTPMLDQQEGYTPALLQDMARQSLETAIFLKPDSPQVLGTASIIRTWRDKDYEGALALAERALKIDPGNIEALWAHYALYERQPNLLSAARTAERLIKLEPLSVRAAGVHWQMLMLANRYEEALAIAERMLSFYPEKQVPGVYAMVSDSKLQMGDRLGAINSFRKGPPYGYPVDLWTGLAIDPATLEGVTISWKLWSPVYNEDYDQVREMLVTRYADPVANSEWLNSTAYLVYQGEVEALAGNIDTSIDYFERARLLAPPEDGGYIRPASGMKTSGVVRQSFSPLSQLFTYRRSGRHEIANRIATQFEEFLVTQRAMISTISGLAQYLYLYQEAQYHAIEGRTAEAIGKLRTWMQQGIIFTYISWDPFLDDLRGDPEFETIVAEVEAELADVRAQYHATRAALAKAENG